MKFTIALFVTLVMLAATAGCSTTKSATTAKTSESSKATAAANADDQLSEEQKVAKRKSLDELASKTLKELVAKNPEIQQKLDKAYGYAVFEDSVYNAVLYVGGNGNGVAYDNATHTPTYMIMLRAGTGPGVGYTKYRQLLIISNELAFKELTTLGFDVDASANATFKLSDLGGSTMVSGSFNPYLHAYTITDSGVDVQANWGGMEYLKNIGLN